MAKAGSFKREIQDADLMHDQGKLNPGVDLPLIAGDAAVRFAPMATSLTPLPLLTVAAGCGRNDSPSPFAATWAHKKFQIPLFRICSIPILTFDNEPPGKDYPSDPRHGELRGAAAGLSADR
ncbi:hypothetical protein CO653_20825 [Rhizobium anhuiense]|jgi:hypothetical protein|uniref:hypothetical protein n=1 Tax=Rhizobium TaxID=379 RepID=UPI0007B53384|nr:MULTISPECIES: hypothetical protein [Rhizobium]KZS50663.1 hypothetical protein AS890_24895 [Rhizobium anhuiense bv. trifolii]MBB3742139.1 hypothetical protein [Rhizobium sp. BK591]MBB4213772.1 hypothetical protein [Rhizobium sp. BK212]PDS63749.1 hypothetical protein CO653_20825 [Rhizobium anhuiense]